MKENTDRKRSRDKPEDRVQWKTMPKGVGPGCEQFKYSLDDLQFEVIPFCVEKPSKVQLSRFDTLVRSGWDDRMTRGHFRYDLSELTAKHLPGKYHFTAQLNLKRGVERRRPQYIDHVNMPYDPDKFNFTKIKPQEILFDMCPQDHDIESPGKAVNGSSPLNGSTHNSSNTSKENNGLHPVLINVSPLEYGHILVVPDVDQGIPQRLTLRATRLVIDCILLSSHPGMRAGFNSLCAFASVNHQHIHAWYSENSLYTENVAAKELRAGCGCFELVDQVCRGFVFQLHNNTVAGLTRQVHSVVNFLQETEVAHNLYVTRGTVLGAPPGDKQGTVRVYVWPRETVKGMDSVKLRRNIAAGIKNESGMTPFNVAVAEMGGQLPMYDTDAYETMQEADCLKIIEDIQFSKETFDKIKEDVLKVVTETNQIKPVLTD